MWTHLVITRKVAATSGRSDNVFPIYSLQVQYALSNLPDDGLSEISQLDRFDDGWILSRMLREEKFTEYGKRSRLEIWYLGQFSFKPEMILRWLDSESRRACKEQGTREQTDIVTFTFCTPIS